jgi:hypothetical protein
MKQPRMMKVSSMAIRTSQGSKPLVLAQVASAAGRPERAKKPFSTSAPNRMK